MSRRGRDEEEWDGRGTERAGAVQQAVGEGGLSVLQQGTAAGRRQWGRGGGAEEALISLAALTLPDCEKHSRCLCGNSDDCLPPAHASSGVYAAFVLTLCCYFLTSPIIIVHSGVHAAFVLTLCCYFLTSITGFYAFGTAVSVGGLQAGLFIHTTLLHSLSSLGDRHRDPGMLPTFPLPRPVCTPAPPIQSRPPLCAPPPSPLPPVPPL